MCLKQIQTYNNYPTKISTIITGCLITPILYNSKLYNCLYTSNPTYNNFYYIPYF